MVELYKALRGQRPVTAIAGGIVGGLPGGDSSRNSGTAPNVPIQHSASTGSTTRVRDPWKWYLPHRAIILLGIVLTAIALAGAFLGVANASEAESLNSQVSQRYLVLLEPVPRGT